MITKWLISLVKFILTPVFAVLPSGTIGWLSAAPWFGIADTIGTNAGGWDGIIPTVFMLQTMASTVAILFPALMIYKIANWIWRHIPEIAGFGPGAG